MYQHFIFWLGGRKMGLEKRNAVWATLAAKKIKDSMPMLFASGSECQIGFNFRISPGWSRQWEPRIVIKPRPAQVWGFFFNHEWLDPGSLKYLCLTQLPEARGRRLTRGPNWQTGKDRSSPHPRFQLWHFAKVHFFGPKRLIFSGQTKI